MPSICWALPGPPLPNLPPASSLCASPNSSRHMLSLLPSMSSLTLFVWKTPTQTSKPQLIVISSGKPFLSQKASSAPSPCPSRFCIFLFLYWCCIIECLPVPTRLGAPWLWGLNLVHLWILRAGYRTWYCGYSLNVHWQVKGGSSDKL